ncbi:MAG: glycosyltransferase family 4 protein [Verrucomicrobia bacterium]|nr:glycosyltransferase family 4 protein [Verrucomicrobiota bacterium]
MKQETKDGALEVPHASAAASSESYVREVVFPSANGLSDAGRSATVALLTGGADKPYALGLAGSLISQGVAFEFIGSDEVNGPELQGTGLARFLNLRGDQRQESRLDKKVLRVLIYYARLVQYASMAKPGVFHILWNNKLEWLDRTLLLYYYRLCGKRIAFTAHNINVRQRDGNDTWLNRLTLKIQYRTVDHIFVHTERMKRELEAQFGVRNCKISVIPFGINSTVPNSALTSAEARQRLGLTWREKAVLFFGNIAPYKGLEYLVEAMGVLARAEREYRLIIVGKPKDCTAYWDQVQRLISRVGLRSNVIERIEYIPDEETEIYFKAADVLALAYTHIFQSGVLSLGYNFGLPVVASDVGSFKEDIVEGRTGFVCRPMDSEDLARAIREYFESDLYRELETRRQEIREFACERYSWTKVAAITRNVYEQLQRSR